MTAGYSGTPLAKKLGVKDGQKTWRSGMPASVARAIAESGVQPTFLQKPVSGIEMAHLFVTKRQELALQLGSLVPLLRPDGTIWVSWPKKRAKVATDLTEDTIRAEALRLDLVDIKVCAVDETWSGLKLVIRKEKRHEGPAKPNRPMQKG
jgi:hypothetical protein